MQCKPGEEAQELAARIHQDAATWDLAFIRDPGNKVKHARYIHSISNEAVLKALFKIIDNERAFHKSVEVEVEM